MNVVILKKGIIPVFRKLKLKIKKLEEYGFKIGTDFKIIYTQNKILLKVIHSQKQGETNHV